MNNVTPIEKFYTLSQLRPLLHKNKEPISYKRNEFTPISTPSTELLLRSLQPDGTDQPQNDLTQDLTYKLATTSVDELKLAGMGIGKFRPSFRSVEEIYKGDPRIRRGQFHLS